MAHSLAGRQATDSPNILVPTAFRLRWHRRAMYATEATGLPLSIQWYGAQICKASSGLKHDNKYCSRLCLWQAWHRLTQWNNQVMDPNHLQQYADVISAKGSPLDNCFGFVDGTVSTHKSPRTASEGCIQWTQESPCIKISICCSTEWVNRKPIWPNRR